MANTRANGKTANGFPPAGGPPAGGTGAEQPRLAGRSIDADLLDEITARVLALLAEDLKIERERDRRPWFPPRGNGG